MQSRQSKIAETVSTKSEKEKRAKRLNQHSPEPSRRGAPLGFHADILTLQREAGNHAVSQLLQRLSDPNSLDQSSTLTVEVGSVHTHRGPAADAHARAEGAAAYTQGRDVYLSQEVDLADDLGQRVLAHELAHVVQQSRGQAGETTAGQASLEREANNLAGLGVQGAIQPGAAVPGTVQRITEEELMSEWRRLHPRRKLPQKTAAPGELSTIDEGADRADREAYRAWRDERLSQLRAEAASLVRPWSEADEARRRASAAAPEMQSTVPMPPTVQPETSPSETAQHARSEVFDFVPVADPSRRSATFIPVAPAAQPTRPLPVPTEDWATEPNKKTPEERVKETHEARTPLRKKGQQQPALQEFYSEYDRAIDEGLQELHLIPGVRLGWLLGELATGETASGRAIDREQKFKEASLEAILTLSSVIGPEEAFRLAYAVQLGEEIISTKIHTRYQDPETRTRFDRR